MMLRRLIEGDLQADLTTASGRAVVEERYWSLRKQVPVIYVLGFVNLSALELATCGHLRFGINLPTFIGLCGLIRLAQWFGRGKKVSHEVMVRRLRQTVWFAGAVCLAVCARCVYLLQFGDVASHMAVLLFGGLTAIGVAYGLTALPLAGRIPLILIIGPISMLALVSTDPQFMGAAFALVTVALLTMRLLASHSRHFEDLIRSRSQIAHEQQRVESAHQEAITAATTDFLTGLPNRRAFVAALEMASDRDAGDPAFAVAILDLDRFKPVNDTFGHAVGDELLQEVARRLVASVGEGGTVARLGGDEFGVFYSGVRTAAEAYELGRQIIKGVNGPAFIRGHHLVVSACCGLALRREGEFRTPSRVMTDADLALYEAKESPGGEFAVFEPKMDAPRWRRTRIESALLAPGVSEHLSVVFQPIFDLETGLVMAHEALGRWTDPKIGAVSPSEFVPIAEQLNLIDGINNQLMSMAFNEARNWPGETKVSFNLSAVQLCSRSSARTILDAASAAHLDPARLQVEVTETSLLANFERARENLAELKQAGATIVLDDFGAGYASIGYLRQLRFDQIKLDGGLVTAAQHSLDAKRLLSAVVALCNVLGVSSIAEHVESEELLKLVIELGCTGAQGFWLKRPVRAAELHALHPLSVRRTVATRNRDAA